MQTAIEHMEELVAQLPAMEEKQRVYAEQMKAARIEQQYEACDDLEQALAILEAQNPLMTPEGPTLHAQLLDEKRAQLAREKRRLDALVASTRFATPVEAMAARMDRRELNRLIAELNRFREDYGYTLSRCLRAS